MYELNLEEIDQVSGAWNLTMSVALTIGLMALVPVSVAVMTVGLVALGFYTVASMYQ